MLLQALTKLWRKWTAAQGPAAPPRVSPMTWSALLRRLLGRADTPDDVGKPASADVPPSRTSDVWLRLVELYLDAKDVENASALLR